MSPITKSVGNYRAFIAAADALLEIRKEVSSIANHLESLVLNMRSWTWSRVEAQAGTGTTPCAGHSLIPWDGKLLSVAGHTKDPSETLQVKVFDLQTCTWSTLKTYGKPPDQKVISSGRNRTNETRNATRHAEMEAIDVLLEQWQKNGLTKEEITLNFLKCTLYVTCEPCIMCAAALSIIGVEEVYYGCANDKFGGCGSILSLHTNNSGKLPRLKNTMNGEEVVE